MSDTSTTVGASLQKVVSGGYCIGCGGCASVSKGIAITMGGDGQYRAEIDPGTAIANAALSTCPFSDEGPDEDVLGRALYGESCTHNKQIGWYEGLYAGHISEGRFREYGASGGVITWILTQLLERDLVDAVIHVRPTDQAETGGLFQYSISKTVEEIAERAKSRYYPIEISQALDEVRRVPGRYAFVGLPCFVKTVRKMAEEDAIIKERIVHTVGLVCGHLKSKNFSDYLAWETGINPGDLEEIDFRVKLPSRGASDYGVYVRSPKTESTTPIRSFLGGDWGLNFFRYSACDYCDDVFAETADVAVGDAWLPDYSAEAAGNSVVVVRSPVIGQVIANARSDGRVQLDSISPEQMVQSQAGGLRDRRQGLAYRLFLKQRTQLWAPRKRVEPSDNLGKKRLKIYEQRLKLRRMSHKAWQKAVSDGSVATFTRLMLPDVKRMRSQYSQHLLGRVVRKLGRTVKRLSHGKH